MTQSDFPRSETGASNGLEDAIRDMADAITALIKSNKADNDRAAERAEKADKRASRMLFMLGVATAFLAVGMCGIGFTACVAVDNTKKVGELAGVVTDLADETRLAKEGVTEATEQAKEIAAAAPRVEVVTPATSASSGKAAKAPQLAVVIPARTATPKTSGSPAAPAAPAVTVLIPASSAAVGPAVE